MLNNNIKIAFRQLKRQKFYSLINIGGLALSIACTILIGLYIRQELSYDQHFEDADRIYRVTRNINLNDWTGINPVSPAPLAKALLADYPEIEKAGRLTPYFAGAGTNLVRIAGSDQKIFEEGFVYADQSIFDIFKMPMVYGQTEGLLDEPNAIVISKKIADNYFPDENPIGQTLILNTEEDFPYKITGVIENLPDNTHFHYDFFLSNENLESSKNNAWVSNNFYTYVLLAPGADPKKVDKRLALLEEKYLSLQFKDQLNIDMSQFESTGYFYHFFLDPLTNIHLYSYDQRPQLEANGDIRYVWLFAIIAILILAIAVINYVNLSTALFTKRAKEVGVRKVLGAKLNQLIRLFLTESVLVTFAAFLVALLFVELFSFYGKEYEFFSIAVPWKSAWLIPDLIGAAIIIGLFAGLYPALQLSRAKPVSVLKRTLNNKGNTSNMRSSLVVFQFATSTILIVSTIVIYSQISYIQNKKIGFDKGQTLLIRDAYTLSNGDFSDLQRQLDLFKTELKKLPEVQNASVSNFLPTEGFRRNGVGIFPEGDRDQSTLFFAQRWLIDYDYINTLGMEITAGRDFSSSFSTDSQAVIINQTAAKLLNYDDPIGRTINFNNGDNMDYTIVGVVNDFHFQSIKERIDPVFMRLGLSSSTISVKSSTEDMSSLIKKAETIWAAFVPDQAFRYSFLDQHFNQMYNSEKSIGQLFAVFSLLAIFIACLGLFALATFIAEQKNKEIGVRKVLGASVSNIVTLLSKDFLRLVIFALIIAIPIAWYGMNHWLSNFTYRINIQWWVFVLAGFLSISIAFITVSFQSIKAALANPVESLRDE